MKKILVILFLLTAFFSKAQYPGFMPEFKVFNDTSEMVKHVATNGAVVLLRGFEGEDGKGCFFQYNDLSTATPNGSTVFAVTGVATGRWLRMDIYPSIDTSGQWVYDVYKRADSFFYAKNGTETFIGLDNSGGTVSDTSFQWSVLDSLSTPPVGPATGDIILVGTSPTGAFVGHANEIATWDGASWTFQTASIGDLLYNATTDFVSKWTGTAWVRVGRGTIHQGGDRYAAPIVIGSIDNRAMRFKTNNTNRITIAQTGSITFNSLTGSGNQIMGLDATGLASRVAIGTGLSLSAGTLTATGAGGIVSMDAANGLTARNDSTVILGGTLDQNTSIAGASFDLGISGVDSLTASGNKTTVEGINNLSLASTDTIQGISGNWLLFKATTAKYLASVTADWGYGTGTAALKGWQATSAGTFLKGGSFSNDSKIKIAVIDTTTGLISWNVAPSTIPTSYVSSWSAGTTGFTPNTATTGAVTLAGTLGTANGGTNLTSYTTGDLLYASSSSVLSKLPIGTAAQTLHVVGGLPAWRDTAVTAAGASGANPTASVILTAVNGVATTFMRSDAAPPLDQSIAPTWTGVHTWNVLSNNAVNIGGTWTASANSQRHVFINPNITGRATASDSIFAVRLQPTLNGGAASQIGGALVIDPKYGGTALGQQNAIIHRGTIRPFVTNTDALGGNGDVYSNVWATNIQTANISFNNVGGASMTFTNQQGTGGTMFSHGHFVIGEGSNGVTDDSSQLHVKGDLEVNGIKAVKLASISISSVTNSGVAGSTRYTYVVAAYCFNQTIVVSDSLATTTGNATLSGSNFNVITWTQVVGAYKYVIYRITGGSAQGVITTRGQAATSYNDQNGASATAATTPPMLLNGTGSISLEGGIVQSATLTAAGTTGARTINKYAGSVNIAAGQGNVVVTNNLVSTTSLIFCQIMTNDATATSTQVVPAAGSFTIYLNANATAETKVAFQVINTQ